MLKLLNLKKKHREAFEGRGKERQILSPSEMRMQKDISELDLAETTSIYFPNGKDNLLNFDIIIHPDKGYYQGGSFLFTFEIPYGYPHRAPKVKCRTKVYHPNIDSEGNVCLNILREDWNPVLSVNSIIFGLEFLFLDPNPDDALNNEAGKFLKENPRYFGSKVRSSINEALKGLNVTATPSDGEKKRKQVQKPLEQRQETKETKRRRP